MIEYNLNSPSSEKCYRCGYCCKYLSNGLPFTKEDKEKWYDEDWYEYHPFIDWVFYDFHSPMMEGLDTVQEARKMIKEAEIEFYKDYVIEPIPFPWGRTLQYCPFLKWMENKWGCLLHEKGLKPKICREYNCYWDRLEAGFKWLFSTYAQH